MHPLRHLWQHGRFTLARHLRRPVAGRFQPYQHTLPNRYPWLFNFARTTLQDVAAPRLLSFGCSRGDELVSLRATFPQATIRGLDIGASAIAACRARVGQDRRTTVAVAADAAGEPDDFYDAIFCLAVLCHGDLTARRAQRSERLFPFSRFERAVADLARCIRPGGLLFLHSTNFRFEETATASLFDTVLEARPEQMPPDLIYDRFNRLIPGARYCPIGFRKRTD